MPVNTLTLIFAAPQPARVSVAAKADAHLIRADGSAEYSQLTADRTLRQGSTYMVVSSVSIADADSLRAAGTDYPAWVKERYLQLPESLPDSVRQQAKAIAGDKATPYDKASAIEAWLRENVKYDDQTPAPPEDEDGVAYVLSVRRGYCDYYASAMAVMLRSLNVPARIAVGYAQGKYDEAAHVYRVTEKDSHTWVEVFFPKYGWVEFEPTASQPAVVRPTPQPTAGAPTPTPNPDDANSGGPRPTRTRFGPDEGDVPFGPLGGTLTNPLGNLLNSWVGLVGSVGIIIALAFVLLWVIERRRPGGLRTARRVTVRAEAAGKTQPLIRQLLQIISRLGMRAWLGLLGVVELALAMAIVLVLSLGQSQPAYRLNATVQNLGTWLGAIALVEIVVILLRSAIWVYERRGTGGLSLAAQLYARLLRFSGWLNVRWKESQTAHERGEAFASAAPAAHDLILEIVDNYTREQYSPTPPDTSNAEKLWQATSPMLWWAGVRQRVGRVRDRWRNFGISWDALSRRLGSQFR
jgi:transglutaminase-like putative cysteine protease